jgi:hypothetical protein
MIPSALCWLALHISLPLHQTEVLSFSKNAEQKGAPKQHGKTTGQGINRVRDTKIAGASLPPY